MDRRTMFKAAGAATLGAASAPALAQGSRTLRFIAQIDLTFLDPHFSTANISRNHAYMVYDTLFGLDENYNAKPQMLEGFTTSNDGKQWDLKLRENLWFHDGDPVRARDCVASLKRWAVRDAFGGALMRSTDELTAVDDRTIRFTMKRPFPLLPDALGKFVAMMPAIMPERLANTDPNTQVTEIIGSGPFRYVASERLQGARNVYQKFDRYVPRADGPAIGTAGPKVVHFDRVVWSTIPDSSTAAGALLNNEQDWWEYVSHDLAPMVRRARGITMRVQDETGTLGMLRPNFLQPPFDNPAIRKVVMKAIDQTACMQAIVGDDRSLYHTPLGFFCPNTPMASEVGLEPLKGPRDYEALKQELIAAGYKGERVVMMVASDYLTMKLQGDVVADSLKRIGMNVDYLVTDWGSMLQRRTNRGPVDRGGWSCFITTWTGTDWVSPAVHISIRGRGEAGYPGWNNNPRLEELYTAWMDAPDLATRQAICRDIQLACMEECTYYPLGQFKQASAWRGLRDVQPGFTKFWGVRPA
jgi:peptide/nickel transport system substrate-binding protein